VISFKSLPEPPVSLRANNIWSGNTHWRTRCRDAREYAQSIGWMALKQVPGRPRYKHSVIQVTWYHRQESHFQDGDGALFSLKKLFDGLTDGGIFANDRYLVHLPVVQLVADKVRPKTLDVCVADPRDMSAFNVAVYTLGFQEMK